MGTKLRLIRRMQDITQVELANKAGISQPFLTDLEKGRRNAKPETWERIAQALGTTVEAIKGERDETADNRTSG